MSVKNEEKTYKPLFYNDIKKNNLEIKNLNQDYSPQNKTFFYINNQNAIIQNNSNLINDNKNKK